MTYSECNNLRKGDVVYYVNVRWQTMTIEPIHVYDIVTIPFRNIWLQREGSDLTFLLTHINADLCFLNLDEASKRLEELINNHDEKRRKTYDV